MVERLSVYQATLEGRQAVYDAYLAAGKGTPFLYPWDTLPFLYLFLGIFLRPYLSPSSARRSGVVIFVITLVHSVYICLNRRTLGFASGYGIGLICTWGVIMTGVLLVLHAPESDFLRLEVRESDVAATYTQAPEGVSYSTGKEQPASRTKHRKAEENDFTQTFQPQDSKRAKRGIQYGLIWQPLPSQVLHRADWAIDLMSTFRGPNWNFRIPTLPKIKTVPPSSQFTTSKSIVPTMLANEVTNPSNPNLASVHRDNILSTIKLYLLLDLVKFVITTDPYFLGLRPLSSQSPWPYFHNLPFVTRAIRLCTAIISIVSALSFVFSLAPLFFYTVLPALIPQKVLSRITKSPLYDPRMYQYPFASPYETIPTTGLSAFWGRSWHQMFRFGISEPSKPIVRYLKLHPRSQLARAIQVLVAFFLTGLLHTVASSTTFSIIPSKPWDPMLFFITQSFGIMIQDATSRLLTKQLKLRPPVWARKVTNVAFVTLWLWFTGPLLADDFARAGIWLFEPLPVSFVRGLLGQGWWCWGGQWAGMWEGSGVFNRGVAFF